MRLPLLLSLILGSVLAARAAQPAGASGDYQQLQGVWKPVRLERQGELVSDSFLMSAQLVFRGDTLLFQVGDKTFQKLRFTIDPMNNPGAMDLTTQTGPAQRQTVHALYRLEGNRLLLCWPLENDRERPSDFAGKGGNHVTLTLERG